MVEMEATKEDIAGLLEEADAKVRGEEFAHKEDPLTLSLGVLDWCRKNDQALLVEALRILISCHRLKALEETQESERRKHLDTAEGLAVEECKKFAEKGNKKGQVVMLLAQADVLYERKGVTARAKCKEAAEKAFALMEELGDKKLEADALLTMVYAHAKVGEGQQACGVVDKALAAYENLNDSYGRAKSLMAKAALFEGLRKDGIPAAKKAVALLRELGNKKLLANELHTIAQWHLWSHRPRDALPFAMEATHLYQELHGFKEDKAGAMATVVKCLNGKEDFTEALRLSLEAVEKTKAEADLRAQVVCLNTLVATQTLEDANGAYPGDHDEALSAAREAVSVCQKMDNKSWGAHMTRSVAMVMLMLKFYEDAIVAARTSIEAFRALGEKEEEANALRTLADVHIAEKNYRKATEVASDIALLWQAEQDKVKEAGALLVLADIQHMESKTQKRAIGFNNRTIDAMGAAAQALSIYQEEGDLQKVISTWAFVSAFQQDQGNLQDAIEAAQYAAELSEMDGDFRMQARYLHRVAGLLAEEHPGAAANAAEQALKAARAGKSIRLEVEMLILLSQVSTAKAAKDAAQAAPASRDALWFKNEPKALRPAREALMIARKMREKHGLTSRNGPRGLFPSALYALGEVYLLGSKGEEALHVGQEAQNDFSTLDDERGQAASILLQAEAHYMCKRQSDAQQLANDALQRFRDLKDTPGEDRALSAIERFKKVAVALAVTDGDVLGGLGASAAAVTEVKKVSKLDPVVVSTKVKQFVIETAASDDDDEVHLDSALMDAGIDSLAAVSFTNALSSEFELRMPASLIFDYPNINAVVTFIMEESAV